MGLPVVALDIAGVPSVVKDGRTGLLVAERDPAAFGQAIARLLIDAGERRQLGTAASEWVRSERGIATAARTLSAALQSVSARVGQTELA